MRPRDCGVSCCVIIDEQAIKDKERVAAAYKEVRDVLSSNVFVHSPPCYFLVGYVCHLYEAPLSYELV